MTNSELESLIEMTKSTVQEECRGGDNVYVTYASCVAHRLKWSVQKVVALWRHHESEIGGKYHKSSVRRGDKRAFNVDERRTRHIEAKFIFRMPMCICMNEGGVVATPSGSCPQHGWMVEQVRDD